MKIILTVVFFSFALISSASAKKYADAGCGLGSQAFPENKIVSQVLGATTNGTSWNQTFGISSGTSNCVDDGTVAQSKRIPAFIEANQIALANDIARGSGETLASLANVLGCDDTQKVGSTLQQNYSKIFSTENIKSEAVTDSILETVRGDKTLASGCRHII